MMSTNCKGCAGESRNMCDGCHDYTRYMTEDEVALVENRHSSTDILEERGSRYGRFEDNSLVTQQCEDIFKTCAPNYFKLLPIQREALHMIIQKLSRAACGDALYADNWVDICGYAECVVRHLEENE